MRAARRGAEGRPNLVARLRRRSDGPRLCLLGHVDTVLADPDEWSVDPWSGELRDGCVWGRGAIDMKSQVAAEVAAGARARRGGLAARGGRADARGDRRRGGRRGRSGAKWLCASSRTRCAATWSSTRAAARSSSSTAGASTRVCVAEKGVFRFTLATEGRAGHASMPRIGDNALTKLAPVLEALRERRPVLRPLARAGGAARGARPRPVGPRGGARESRRGPAAGRAARADAGRDAHADDDQRLGEDQRDPRARRAAGRLPRAAGAGRGPRAAPDDELLGDERLRGEFDETVVGNRSPLDTPLMDAIRALRRARGPRRRGSRRWCCPASPTRTGSARRSPTASPTASSRSARWTLFEAVPLMHAADERIPVGGPRPGRPLLLLSWRRRRCG